MAEIREQLHIWSEKIKRDIEEFMARFEKLCEEEKDIKKLIGEVQAYIQSMPDTMECYIREVCSDEAAASARMIKEKIFDAGQPEEGGVSDHAGKDIFEKVREICIAALYEYCAGLERKLDAEIASLMLEQKEN